MERYLRLKEEVSLLISDVERVKATQESSEKLLQVSPTDLLHDVSEGDEEFVCVTVSGELLTKVRILPRTLFFEGIMQSM